MKEDLANRHDTLYRLQLQRGDLDPAEGVFPMGAQSTVSGHDDSSEEEEVVGARTTPSGSRMSSGGNLMGPEDAHL